MKVFFESVQIGCVDHVVVRGFEVHGENVPRQIVCNGYGFSLHGAGWTGTVLGNLKVSQCPTTIFNAVRSDLSQRTRIVLRLKDRGKIFSAIFINVQTVEEELHERIAKQRGVIHSAELRPELRDRATRVVC